MARRIAAQAQGDLLVLERTPNEKGVLRQQIAVDDVRRTVSFFGSTAGEGGWRIAIVDAVDELNRSSANALLKVLEEPPQRALLLLVSHSAARVPATLRSRCRDHQRCGRWMRPTWPLAVAAATGTPVSDPRVAAAASAAEGSVARALALLDEDALALRQQALDLLDGLPALDANAFARARRCARRHRCGAARRLRRYRQYLAIAALIEGGGGEIGRLARLAEVWERINTAARDAEIYNLERKPFVFGVFGLLAEATRG